MQGRGSLSGETIARLLEWPKALTGDMADEHPAQSSPSDADVLAACGRGEPGMLDLLIHRHGASLWAYLRRMSQDDLLAEDVFQETWLRVWRSAGSFKGRSSFKTWLYRIATNLFRDEMRRNQRTPQHISLQSPAESAKLGTAPVNRIAADNLHDPRSHTGDLLTAEVIERALDSLPDRERAAFVLRHVQDLSYAEVADVLGCGKVTVRVYLHRALLRLRKLLAEEGVTE